MEYWNRKTFVLITGASRGIGKCIATEFAKAVGPGSVLLLIARSLQGLETIKAEIIKASNPSQNVKVATAQMDLSKPDFKGFQSLISTSLKEVGLKNEDFEHVILVQNAVSSGIQSGLKVVDMTSASDIQDYYSFNLVSFMILNSAFFGVFPAKGTLTRSVVHMSSDGVVTPFKTWGLYCAAKAGRDNLLKSLALESGIHALNYAPGCVETEMYDEAIKYTADPEVKAFFDEHRKAGKCLTPFQTVSKLMKVLESGKYIQGEHVTYYDEI